MLQIAELLAVATILHDLGLTDRYTAENRFEVDGANAARSFLKGRGISTQQTQVVWDAIALHTTRSIALHKEPEVAMTHSGITADVLGAGLDRIPQDKQGAILAEFPRLALKNGLKECLCNIARRKPESTFDNIVRDFGVRYVEGYTSPNFADCRRECTIFRIDDLPIIELRTRISAAIRHRPPLRPPASVNATVPCAWMARISTARELLGVVLSSFRPAARILCASSFRMNSGTAGGRIWDSRDFPCFSVISIRMLSFLLSVLRRVAGEKLCPGQHRQTH